MTFSPVDDAELESLLAEIQERLEPFDADDLDARWAVVRSFIDSEVGLVVAIDQIDEDSPDDDPIRDHRHLRGDDIDLPREGLIEAIDSFEPDDGAPGEYEYDSVADPDMGAYCTEVAFRRTDGGAVLIVGAFDLDGEVDTDAMPGREGGLHVTRTRWQRRLARRFGPGGGTPAPLALEDIEPIEPDEIGPFLDGLAWNLVHESASAIYADLAWPVLRSLMDDQRGIYMAVDQLDPDEDDDPIRLAGWIPGTQLDEPNELLMDFVLLCADLLPDVLADLDAIEEDDEFESVVSVTAGPSMTCLALRMTPNGPIIVGLFDTDSLPDDEEREAEIADAYDRWVEAVEAVYGAG